MHALTIWQPWASLIAVGAKPYEWRGWRCPSAFVGRRIAIHAGARPVKKDEIRELLLDIRRDPAATSLDPDIAYPPLETWLAAPGSLPLRSILCTAVLGQPITARQYAERQGGFSGDSDRIDHSKWGWPLEQIERLEPIVPATGSQGFWIWRHTP